MLSLQIKYLLAERGYTQARIARELKVTHTAINNTIWQRHSHSFRIELRIAEILGLPVLEVFPDHRPKPRRRSQQDAA